MNFDDYKIIIDELKKNNSTSDENLLALISMPLADDIGRLDFSKDFFGLGFTDAEKELFGAADRTRRSSYGTDVYVRGLIEISNYCRNNCYYCGIRSGNPNIRRYHLTPEEIKDCADEGYELGFRTFVIQGGEDGYYTDELLCALIGDIKETHPDCAVTLSLGERTYQSFKRLFDAGADRYLLRHETANESHYAKLHPKELSLKHRKDCLYELKEIGYQVGSGFMVDSPYQTAQDLLCDLKFLKELVPDMIGIGPFIRASDTPFENKRSGRLAMTLRMLAILRLMFPYALLPSTTALGTIHPLGRELGLKCGANVLMPNLSPVENRKLYSLYENKICTGDESAQCRDCLNIRVSNAGYQIVTSRGDVIIH